MIEFIWLILRLFDIAYIAYSVHWKLSNIVISEMFYPIVNIV